MIPADAVPRLVSRTGFREFRKGVLCDNGLALNLTAAFVFKACRDDVQVSEIVSRFRERFNVDDVIAWNDVNWVITELLANGAVDLA